MNSFENITNEKFIEVFNVAESKSEICKKFNLPNNGTSYRFINNKIKELNLDIKIFNINHFNKYHLKKVCPVCGKEFYTDTTFKGRKKICCSYGCSNTYFRSGESNGMYYKATKYSTICFKYHQHKCCVCGEEKIVAVHHYDGNHNNNEISNLVPLCPTHHCYIHSNYKDEIIDKVDEYRNNFIKENGLIS